MTTNQLLVEIVGATNLSPHTSTNTTTSSSSQGSVLNPLTTLGNVSSSISNASSSVLHNTLFANREASVNIKVLLNQDCKIHKTSVVGMTNHPIWTVESGSLFLVDLSEESMSMMNRNSKNGSSTSSKNNSSINNNNNNKNSSGNNNNMMLTFEIRDRDPLMPGKSACIGTVRVDVATILADYCTEERTEFPIVSDVYQAAREGILSWNDNDNDEDGEDSDDSDNEAADLLFDNKRRRKRNEERGATENKNTANDHRPPSSLSPSKPFSEDIATLALRFRKATPEDVAFIQNLEAGKMDLILQDSMGIEATSTGSDSGSGSVKGEKREDDSNSRSGGLSRSKSTSTIKNKKNTQEAAVSARRRKSTLMTEDDAQVIGGAVNGIVDSVKFTLSASQGRGHKLKKRVRPGPDPGRAPEQTRFLSEEELIAATYSPSKSWIECGSGMTSSSHDNGYVGGSGNNNNNDNNNNNNKVLVEILHCDDLPNCDAGGGLSGGKTNAFACIVHEDAAAQTDVINSCLSPLWPPWTKRAFAFNRTHPLSSVYVGVFHYDAVSPLGHVGIGRVAINVQQLRPEHDYILKYRLFDSSVYSNRVSRGAITLRIRIEGGGKGGGGEKALLLNAIMKQPMMALPQIQINVKKKKTYAVVKYTLYGRRLEDKFDINLLKSQASEMSELLWDAQYTIVDAVTSLVFWRGQVVMPGGGGRGANAKFPLYSMLVYVFCGYTVERPHLLPSLFFWGMFFVMISSYGHRRHHPSPWYRCRSITDYICIIAKGKANTSVTHIKAGEGAKETAAMENIQRRRIELDVIVADKWAEMQQKAIEAEEALEDKKKGSGGGVGSKVVPQLDPLSFLIPYQQMIEYYIYYPRVIKSVIVWESSAISLVMTIGSLAAAIMLSILPTAWLIHWVCRICVHLCLGPHMKLVDILINYNNADHNHHLTLGDEDSALRRKEEQNLMKKLAKEFQCKHKDARLKAENETKNIAMRKVRLGAWCLKVPPLNVTRYCDYPLPADSAAVPTATTATSSYKGWADRLVFPGQTLYGCMIPRQMRNRTKQEDDMSMISSLSGSGKDDIKCNNGDVASDGESKSQVVTSAAIPDEFQQLADYKLRLAQAQADLDASLGSQEEVERLQTFVKELSLSHIDTQGDGSREKVLNDEISFVGNVFFDNGKDNKSVDSGDSEQQSNAANNNRQASSKNEASQDDTSIVSIEECDASQKQAECEEALPVTDSEESRDDDDNSEPDDPFSTYDEGKRANSISAATKDESDGTLVLPPEAGKVAEASPIRRSFLKSIISD